MAAVLVNVDNFARAESNRMLAGLLAGSSLNAWSHFRKPAPLDDQKVIRMNRDTLYSACVADISKGATLTVPERDGRYLSVMIVNQDHYINNVFHEPGDYELTVDEFDTPYVLVAVRTLVNAADPDDVDVVNALQDQLKLTTASERPFVLPDYDTASFDATRQALLALARGLGGFDKAFGRKESVNPVRHLIGTAAGWGGLPEREATYLNVDPGLPVGEYSLTVKDVPVRRLLVDLALQRRRVLRAERSQLEHHKQHHRRSERRRLNHHQLRRMQRQSTQLLATHGRLELHGAPLPTTARGPRRHLDVPHYRDHLNNHNSTARELWRVRSK